MNYSIMIAAVFIVATIAIATMSPFDHLPHPSPQQTAAAPSDSTEGGSYDNSGSDSNDSGDGIRGHWEHGEAPPQ